MKWLNKTLHKLKKHDIRVIIAGHVPPKENYYFESCTTYYSQMTTKYADIIIAHLYGHTHRNEFTLIPTTKLIVFIIYKIINFYDVFINIQNYINRIKKRKKINLKKY